MNTQSHENSQLHYKLITHTTKPDKPTIHHQNNSEPSGTEYSIVRLPLDKISPSLPPPAMFGAPMLRRTFWMSLHVQTSCHQHANGSHQVSLVPHGPSAPINAQSIIIAAVSSTCTTQKIFSPTDFSKKENHGFPSPPHRTLSAPTSVHQHKSTRLTSSFFGASRSVSADQRQKYHHRNVYHTKDPQSNRLLKERKTRVPLTTTPYSLPQLQFTNTKARGSHQVSLVPHGPSASLNGKNIIIAAVSSTCTTQKTLSQTDFSKKETTGSPHHHTILSAPTSVHQHKSTRLTSRFFGASRSVSADQRQKYHHRRCFVNVDHT